MPTIEIQFNKKILAHYQADKIKSISIGRLPDNVIMIDNRAVSERHAVITFNEDLYFIKDLNSTNGTFVNNRLITSRRLHDGDIITIGKHELVFKMTAKVRSEDVDAQEAFPGVATAERTFHLATKNYEEIMAKNIHDSNKSTLLIFKFKGKQLRKYLLKVDNKLTIGRLAENDIVIENYAVSGKHAVITRKEDAYFIDDLTSTNGTFVNGKQIAAHSLKDGDIIAIGKHELVYCEYETYTVEEILLPHDTNQIQGVIDTMHVSKFSKK